MNIVKLVASIITLPEAIRNEVKLIKLQQEVEYRKQLANLGIEKRWNTDLD